MFGADAAAGQTLRCRLSWEDTLHLKKVEVPMRWKRLRSFGEIVPGCATQNELHRETQR